jgi:hypothetical protein
MNTLITILDRIPFCIDIPLLMQKLKIKENSSYASQLQQLAGQAQVIAIPKVIYGLSFIESTGEDWVVIDHVRFKSRILRVNLKDVHRVFPYVATCGVELDEWSNQYDDFLLRYWADAIKEMALRSAIPALNEHLENRYHLGPISAMNPGSLGDFPLSCQAGLFALLGDVQTAIGVQLTKNYLMLPTKSVSGIYFPTEQGYVNCQLCPRENCIGRRAPYEVGLYESRYAV